MRQWSAHRSTNFQGAAPSRNPLRPQKPSSPMDRDISTQDIAVPSTSDDAFLYALPSNSFAAPVLLPSSWIDSDPGSEAGKNGPQAELLAWVCARFPDSNNPYPPPTSCYPDQRRRRISAAIDIAACVRQTCVSLDAASREMTARIKEIDRVIQRVDHLTKTCMSSTQAQQEGGPKTSPAPTEKSSSAPSVTVLPAQAVTGGDVDAGQPGRARNISPQSAATLPLIIADMQEDHAVHAETTVTEASAKDAAEEALAAEVVSELPVMQQIGTGSHRLHPGIDGSSSVKISLYTQQRTAVVTVQAAVQVHPCLQGPDAQGEAECLLPCGREPHMDVAVAFAASAAAQAANDCSRDVLDLTSPALDPAGTSVHPHEAILSTLQHGHVEGIEHRTVSQFSHVSYILKLRHPETGNTCKAIFKPRAQGDFDGWHRTPIERVAYLLNLQLGMDLVPPTVYRHDLFLDNQSFSQDGAMIYFVDEMKDLMEINERDWDISKESLLSDTRILDVLLHNSDRHSGHFGWGKHWTQEKEQPILIDHAAGFRNGAVVCMHHDNAFGTGPTVRVVPSTYLRLKLLDAAVIAKRLHGILSPAEIVDVVKRRDGILSYLDGLVGTHGIENVLVA